MATPSLRVWYLGQQAYLAVPDNALVFDGVQFVTAADADQVALVSTVSVGPVTVPPVWPETQTINQVAMTWTNMILCKILALDGPVLSGDDVQYINDPNNGKCVCFVTCTGTDLQYVQVVLGP